MNPRICVCNNRERRSKRRRRRRRRIGAIGVRTRRVTSGSEVSRLNGEKNCERVELSLTKRKENKQTNKKKRFSVYVRLCSCRLPRRYRVCLKKRNDKKKRKTTKIDRDRVDELLSILDDPRRDEGWRKNGEGVFLVRGAEDAEGGIIVIKKKN